MSLIMLPEPDRGVIPAPRAYRQGPREPARARDRHLRRGRRRAFETDALTAYTRMPLAVVLPRSIEEVAKVLCYCHENGLKVGRGAGTSLCGGALPAEDAIVVGVSKMNRVLEVDLANRIARVEAGITNLAISGAVSPTASSTRPIPRASSRARSPATSP